MIAKYRSGRNVSNVTAKNIVQQSIQAYQMPTSKVKQNNSVSKISQSMDANQIKNSQNDSKVSPPSRLNVSNILSLKANDKRRQLLSDIKRKDSEIGSNLRDQKYTINSRNLGKVRTGRNENSYKASDNENKRTEQSILKLVDNQINKGLKAIKR